MTFPSHANAACARTAAASIESDILGLSLVNPTPADLATVRELGIEWVRMEFQWSLIEPARGRQDWIAHDALVQAALSHEVKIAAVIDYPPGWITGPKDFESSLRAFSASIARRYAPHGIKYWEIFNEPNLPGYGWGSKGDDPAALLPLYVTALQAANAGIRAVDENAVIILGGLSPSGMDPEKYATALYAAGTKDCFDVFAFHPYGRKGQFSAVTTKIRNLLASYGDAEKPIWFNEYGTGTEKYAIPTLRAALDERDHANALFWFTLRDFKRYGWNFGLLEQDGTRKPAFTVLKDYNSR